MKMEKKGNVESMIRKVASTPISGRLNLVQFRNEKKKALTHKGVCEQVIRFAEANPMMPFYAILAVGVGSGAFKTNEYNKGYKYFNADKAKTCYDMAIAYNKHMNIKGKPSDVVWRLVNRYYNKVSHNVDTFVDTLSKAKVMDGHRGHFTELCKNLGI